MSRLPPIDPHDLRDPADPERVERIWARLSEQLPLVPAARPAVGASLQRQGPRQRPLGAGARTLLFAASLAGVFAVGIVVGKISIDDSSTDETQARPLDGSMSDVFAAGTTQRTFALPGGSRLVLQPESMVEVVEVSGGGVRLHLLRGRASVDASTADLDVEVRAGEALVAAPAGSVVTLSRYETDIDIVVERGTADVRSPAGHQQLRVGDISRVPTMPRVTMFDVGPAPVRPKDVSRQRDREATGPDTPPLDEAPKTDDATPPPAVAVAPARSWFALSKADKFDDALKALEELGGIDHAIKSAQSSGELLELAELASMNGKPGLAVQAWRRVADEFATGENGALAAMMLSDVYARAGSTELAAKYRSQAMQSKLAAEIVLCSQLTGIPRDTAEGRKRAVELARAYRAKYPTGTCQGLDDLEEDLKSAEPAEPAPQKDAPPPHAPDPAPSSSSAP
jgi:hypothetical protein